MAGKNEAFAAGSGRAPKQPKPYPGQGPNIPSIGALVTEHARLGAQKATAVAAIDAAKQANPRAVGSKSHREAIKAADAGMAALVPHINYHIERMRRDVPAMARSARLGDADAADRLHSHLAILNPLEEAMGHPITEAPSIEPPKPVERTPMTPQEVQAVRRDRPGLNGQRTGMQGSVAGMSTSDATMRVRKTPGLSVTPQVARQRVDAAVRLAKARARATPGSDRRADLDSQYRDAHALVHAAHPQGSLGDLVAGIAHLHQQRHDAIRANREIPGDIIGNLKTAHQHIAWILKNAPGRHGPNRIEEPAAS